MRSSAFVLSWLALVSCSSPEAEVQLLDTDGVVVAEFFVDAIADTAEERMRGLSGRDKLGGAEALLIEAPVVDEICISNRDVGFGIVAIWAAERDASGLAPVITIEPFSAMQEEIRCHPGAKYVLEVSDSELEHATQAQSLRW